MGSSEMKLGLCVVGCGSFAKTFASSIQPLLPQINLYFASRDLAKAQAYSQMFHGSGAFGSYAEAAGDARVEAMYLCTPHYLHPDEPGVGHLPTVNFVPLQIQQQNDSIPVMGGISKKPRTSLVYIQSS